MTVNLASQTAVGYTDLLRHNRNFRFLWFGQIVSLLGDWFNLVASAALVGMLTQSGLAVGSLFVVRMLAPFFISPVAGVVADRYNRIQILIATDTVRAAVVLAFLLVRDAGDVWLLYVLTAAQFSVSGFFYPARNAILPELAREGELGAMNAISSATWSTMLALGAALGGLVAGAWGIYPAFVLDTVTFLLSAAFLMQIRMPAAPATLSADKSIAASLRQYIDGMKYLCKHPNILFIASQKALFSLCLTAGFQVVMVAISQRVFTVGEGGGISMGLMFGLTGVGTGIGPILARKLTGDDGPTLRKAIIVGYFLIVLGSAATAPLLSLPAVLLASIVRGVGGGIVWVFSTQLLLQNVSRSVHGRVFATEFMFFYLASALASGVVGSALDSSLSIGGIIWSMTVLSLVPMTLWTLSVVRGNRKAG
ncbi:MAG: MFS transporter [Caldilineaceae bacterium SB0670_bin_27]|uniref:MFS transporter n=1 Tax=Caldilineaceae bacterium SB0664_bin_27 TaxID=2605260 RepID=A0A6B0YS01_9CHLR|nr:MFS transporter [Caldilineaceae bacterium SB0664_bin_27]MYJ77214.1 MFS transporter [Caldilineaceae bacterium SB0670_bin_27]